MFTSMFALEMLLKLLACGPLGYIRNPYNIFDGIIVVIRWVGRQPGRPRCLARPPTDSRVPASRRGAAGSISCQAMEVGSPCRHCRYTRVSCISGGSF